ncbi:TIGR02680 family protein [Actinopolymorpha alba]|uniref:TIGR02680 family protein n=1 Tax=Actinopolymorpha alba TaxID=533267 RepID=UPI00039C76A2|nr:TIGR02680 family protein [Actinopolymorpha alba]
MPPNDVVTEMPAAHALPVADEANAGAPETPADDSERWRPVRAGIINVWRYYDETFHFHGGRMLLRGPNGTGKSKALELLLPYLYDANLQPRRLSTFGGTERTMHWNLMGDGYDGTNRVGYVWLEFGRLEGEREEWFTCGARLQASTNTRSVGSTYFTSTQRIGVPGGLALVNDAGRPLTRQDLGTALGDAGQLHDSGGDYRRTVRQTLFPGFTEQKYDALVMALLQLRTPKLSEHLDPGVLSTLLSRALPPLDHGDIAEIAEGFERLDRQQKDLERLDTEVEAADALAKAQLTYARRVLRAAAARLISATSTMDGLTRKARESQEAYERTNAEIETLATRQDDLDAESRQARARIETLTNLDAYREGRELDQLRDQRREAVRRAEGERARADQLAESARDAEERAQAAGLKAEQAGQHADRCRLDAEHAARRPGMLAVFDELAAVPDVSTAKHLLRGAVESRRTQVGQVRKNLREHERAIERRKEAERLLEDARNALATVEARADQARQRHDAALATLTDDLAAWADGCPELPLDVDALTAAAASETAVLTIVNAATEQVTTAITRAEEAERSRRKALAAERDAKSAERAKLERAPDVPPPPYTRGLDRSTLPGAPLWRLVSFKPDVDPSTQAGVEAALEASGLLDAWVFPDGRLDAPGNDAFAEPAFGTTVDGPTLADVLVGESDAPVPAERVARLLNAVAYAGSAPDHVVAVGGDGSWRLAAAYGRWHKPEPSYIGATARERARQRRIAELDAEIAAIDDQLAAVDEALRQLAARRDRLADEVRRRPDHGPLAAAIEALRTTEAELGPRRDAVSRHRESVTEWEERVATAVKALTTTAAQHGLPTRDDALDQVVEALDAFRSQGEDWLAARQEETTAREHASTLVGLAAEAHSSARAAVAAAADREAEAGELAERLAAVESSVGAEYRELVEQIGQLRARLAAIEPERKELGSQAQTLGVRLGRLDSDRRTAEAGRDEAVVERDTAAARFRHLCAGHLPADARMDVDPAAQETTRAVLDTARRVADAWGSVPYEPADLRRAEGRVSDQMHAAEEILAGRADLSFEIDDGDRVLTANVDGLRTGVSQLAQVLRTERDQARTHLTDAERDLFDRTLTGDTRRQLAARIRQAHDLVDTMNHHLAQVRTASKVRVRLDWRVDPQLPTGTREARDLLLRDPARLGTAERDALHTFFRARIDEARALDTSANWDEQLLEVLDYTRWHQFTVDLDRDDGEGWRRVTKRLHGALSGGEKAIVLHLPLFAAASAHYRSTPIAPRLILLDEVFVGVDSVNRGQLLQLLSAFDLDLMLTSDHEWCTYAELDGIAIHQLITDSDDNAVTTARFTWDGRRLRAASDDPDDDGLFPVDGDAS